MIEIPICKSERFLAANVETSKKSKVKIKKTQPAYSVSDFELVISDFNSCLLRQAQDDNEKMIFKICYVALRISNL